MALDSRVAGVGVRVERMGAGAPVFCLHGGGGLDSALPFFTRLADRFAVIAPLQPGFDGSATPDWLDGIDDVALWHLDLMDSLGIGRAHVVGLSLGGWVGMEMGVRAPERLASLTVVGSPGLTVPDVLPADNFLWDAEERARLMVHDQGLADRMLAAPVDEAGQVRRIANWNALARLAWSPRWVSPRLDKWHHRLRMPVHVVWGDDDRLFPPAYADHYAAVLPDARRTLLPACGHLAHVEAPGPLADAIAAFIGEVPA
jgi:pimeloyl-ACP methyl ester carboxylesterase